VESAIATKGHSDDPEGYSGAFAPKTRGSVKFFVHPDGSVVLLPKLPASALRGIVKSRRRPTATFSEMDEAVAEGAAGLARRTKRP
jgi:antitoxin PrlF